MDSYTGPGKDPAFGDGAEQQEAKDRTTDAASKSSARVVGPVTMEKKDQEADRSKRRSLRSASSEDIFLSQRAVTHAEARSKGKSSKVTGAVHDAASTRGKTESTPSKKANEHV